MYVYMYTYIHITPQTKQKYIHTRKKTYMHPSVHACVVRAQAHTRVFIENDHVRLFVTHINIRISLHGLTMRTRALLFVTHINIRICLHELTLVHMHAHICTGVFIAQSKRKDPILPFVMAINMFVGKLKTCVYASMHMFS
jgi:hypothetical protein